MEVIKTLLKHPETDPNLSDKYGYSPLSVAVGNENEEAMELLLQHPKTRSNRGLLRTAQLGDSEKIQELLADHIERVEFESYGGRSLESSRGFGKGEHRDQRSREGENEES